MDRNSICYLFWIYERIRSDSPDMKLIKSHLGENIVLVPLCVHQLLVSGTGPGAEEVAGLMIRMGGLRPVVAVVAASLVSITRLLTASETRNWHQEVYCHASTSAIKVSANREREQECRFYTLPSLPRRVLDLGKGAHSVKQKRTGFRMSKIKRNI